MKYLTFVFAFLLSTTMIQAQTYNTAVGLRMGSGIGLSVQQRIANKTTIEGIVNNRFKQDLVTVTLLGEQHFPILFKRFNVYTGMGVHKGWYTGQANDGIAYDDPFGVSFIAGGEISIGRFNVSYDYKPAFNITGGEKAFAGESSLSVRYIINKRPTKFQKWKNKRKKNKKKKKKDGDGFNWGDIFKKKN